ncbi:unnamed protein product [Prorocentrum cordatum]|uniref:Uncharacterized protein n=1 Tax=Prorocentrum cordatum TaxID=2364126 RepID=A0ABN9S5U0_9DINO|nr:unnamed protein product [Polarella glacialis]
MLAAKLKPNIICSASCSACDGEQWQLARALLSEMWEVSPWVGSAPGSARVERAGSGSRALALPRAMWEARSTTMLSATELVRWRPMPGKTLLASRVPWLSWVSMIPHQESGDALGSQGWVFCGRCFVVRPLLYWHL